VIEGFKGEYYALLIHKMSSHEIKLKRSGENPIKITADSNGFSVEGGDVNIRNPNQTSSVLKNMIQIMIREGFTSVTIKKKDS